MVNIKKEVLKLTDNREIIKETHKTTEQHYNYIVKKIKSLNKKLIQAGRNAILINVLDVEQSFGTYDGGFIFHSEVVFEISYEKPELCDWELIAVLNVVKDENIIHMIGNGDITPEVSRYKQSNSCDHCNHNRKRVVTYVVRNIQTGEYVQVGKSCLSNFIGTDAMILEIIASLNIDKYIKESKEKNPNPSKMYPPPYLKLNLFLSTCLALIEKDKYKDKYAGKYSTGSQAWYKIVSGNITEELFELIESKYEEAENLIAWALRFKNSENEYKNAIATIANTRQVPEKYVNLACSIYMSKKKEDDRKEFFEKVERNKNREVQYQNQRDKLPVTENCLGVPNSKLVQTVYLEKKILTASYYGDIVIFKFRNENNQLLTWITQQTKSEMFEENKAYNISFKIKKYDIGGKFEDTVQIAYVKSLS